MLPPTPSQTVGPFFSFALDWGEEAAQVVADGIRVFGQVLDGAGEPVPDALVETWQPEGFGRCCVDAEGRFAFTTVKPARVAGFDDRVQAPHIDVSVFARGLLKRLVTRIYFPDEAEANAADPALALIEDPGLRETLIAAPERDGSLRFDIHLQGDHQTAFFAV
jgi:protocatechuate 3,4-dioxygenase alpha subunit